MTKVTVTHLAFQARELVEEALADYSEQHGCGSMSCAIYDTAWVSMVTKHLEGHNQWLFPESFHYLLKCQSSDGSWGVSSISQIDGILNTAAGLLAVQKHASEALQMQEVEQIELQERMRFARNSLSHQLEVWNVQATRHVGFEVIVPTLLELLETQDQSLNFEFEGKETLMAINAAKLSRFKPELLYHFKSTALHSLESFIGKIDFDKVKHHLVYGSMMGSPASTAAYLMNTSTWDDEAEEYLKHVISWAAGKGSGGVPSAFPSTYFEYTWILSTLLRGGFASSDLETPGLTKMTNILNDGFHIGSGTIGFAPGFEPDVDDTAKGILALNMLGGCLSAQNMIKSFEAADHFKTYPGERDSSFSANCNALLALLHQPDVSCYSTEILKAVQFLCNYWWDSDANIKDKWNLCHLYPCLLLVEAFVDLIRLVEIGSINPDLFDLGLRSKVLITAFQACSRTLLEQHQDGSWNESVEASAYGILVLCEARPLFFLEDLRPDIDAAVQRSINFLDESFRTQSSSNERIWIEKVSYASPRLTAAYVLAARRRAAVSTVSHGSIGIAAQWNMELRPEKMARYVQLFSQTPLFSSLPQWQTVLSAIEAALFVPLLRARRLEVFPRDNMMKDRYFDIIPFTWTSCNNRLLTFASTSFLYNMMVVSFLNYQADEFMEAVAGPRYLGDLDGLRRLINDIFESESAQEPAKISDLTPRNGHSGVETGSILSRNHSIREGPTQVAMPSIKCRHVDVETPLRQFIMHVRRHPSIALASSWDQVALSRELRTFLLAHVSQIEDSNRFIQDRTSDRGNTREFTWAETSFFQWVRTTSANHTSCPYSFAFVSALLSASIAGGADCFPSPREKYISEAACRHLATMCRMYNDYGSLARDRAEQNLNSLDFPEFDCDKTMVHDEIKKAELFTMASFERSCLELALSRLDGDDRDVDKSGKARVNATDSASSQAEELRTRKIQIWRMFCDVTDLYGQIYVVQDIASRMATSFH